MTRNTLTVEKLAADSIDVGELHRAGLLAGGWVALKPSLRWSGIATMHVAQFRVVLELQYQSVPQNIRVSWTPCNFGGLRPWLHCSHCNRRVSRLFKGLGGYWCRKCLGNPIYESQRRSRKARAYLQAYRIRHRLGGSRPVVDAVPPRTPHMKRRTYAGLCAQLVRLEKPLIGSRVMRYAPRWIAPLDPY